MQQYGSLPLRHRCTSTLSFSTFTILLTEMTIPSSAIAVTRLLQPVLERNGVPGAAAALVCGGVDVGKAVVGSHDIPLSG